MPKISSDSNYLGARGVAVSLISLHYGLGFLLGTSEMVYKNGISGALYAFMCAVGLAFLSLLVPFYWKKRYPIWRLLGRRYGKNVRDGITLLSWLWMIGVLASQVLGAAYIINLVGLDIKNSIFLVILLVSLMSLLPVYKLSKLLLLLLVTNSTILIFGIFKLTTPNDLRLVYSQIPAGLFSNGLSNTLGIALPTVLITMLGMDFHQFVVRGKTVKKTLLGTLMASFILSLIVLLPLLTVIGAQNKGIINNSIDGKQIIPAVLLYLGKQSLGNKLGSLFLIAILTLCLGSGSCMTKILVKTFSEFKFIPKKFREKRKVLLVNAFIVSLLALRGGTIISLIVSFYVIYISGVLVPFVAYILEDKKVIRFNPKSIYYSMLLGSAVALIIMISSKLNVPLFHMFDNLEFTMIISGVLISISPLIVTKVLEKHNL